MPRRENRRGRGKPFRRDRDLVLIVCGSEQTEQRYLRGLRDSVQNPAVDIEVVNKPRAPKQLVQYAAGHVSRSTKDFDEVWCVYDVDEFKELNEAKQLSDRKRYQVAVSNPCFEFWLLLHHEDCAYHLSDYSAVKIRLKKRLPTYDKTKLRFEDFAPGVHDAIDRAKRLGDDSNPSTGMWRLAQRILDMEEKA